MPLTTADKPTDLIRYRMQDTEDALLFGLPLAKGDGIRTGGFLVSFRLAIETLIAQSKVVSQAADEGDLVLVRTVLNGMTRSMRELLDQQSSKRARYEWTRALQAIERAEGGAAMLEWVNTPRV